MSGGLPYGFFREHIKKASALTFFGIDVTAMSRADLMATVAYLAERSPGFIGRPPAARPSLPKDDLTSGYTITVTGGNL